MTKEIKEPVLNYWYRALHSPFGIELICSDPAYTKTKLYIARKDARDTDLEKVGICQSPFDPMRIWIVRKEPSNETP